MQDGIRTGRRHRRAAFGVVGLVVSALVLGACTSSGGGSPSAGGSGGGQGAASTPSGPPMSIDVTPAADQRANPVTPIVVKATNGTLTSVTVTNPATGTQVAGALSDDKTTWTSNEELGYGVSYSVAAAGTTKDGRTVNKTATVTTLNPAKVAYPNMIPAPGSVSGVG